MTGEKTERPKVRVTMRALTQRINRALAKEGEAGQVLKKSRGVQMQIDVGDYWILDYSHNCVWDKHLDPVELAKEMNLLKPWEKVAED